MARLGSRQISEGGDSPSLTSKKDHSKIESTEKHAVFSGNYSKSPSGVTRRFVRCARGVAAIEFAFIAPVLLVFLLGVICYGAYFWMAHDVQQLANDGARSAIAGLDAAERSSIARQTVQRNLGRQDGLIANKAAVSVQEGNDAFTVTVTYDASGSAFWTVIDLFPMPSTTIRRSATVTLGGY